MTTEIRKRLHEIIFEADTRAGRAFDLGLIALIGVSVLVVMLDSVADIHAQHGDLLRRLEWGFTILFTVEYLLRLISLNRPLAYATSFFGVVDLLAILPTYASLFIAGSEFLVVIRFLRVLRVFRILKLAEYFHAGDVILTALRASRIKIGVFLFAVGTVATVIGALMYLIEGPEHGFTSIPKSIYWAIVTLTTVGYGDIAPRTVPGQLLASGIMILGYGIIAVPTGIVTVELANLRPKPLTRQACPACGGEGHDLDARFCKLCGASL